MLLRSVGTVPSWCLDDVLDYLDLLDSPTVVALTAWVLSLVWVLRAGVCAHSGDRGALGQLQPLRE